MPKRKSPIIYKGERMFEKKEKRKKKTILSSHLIKNLIHRLSVSNHYQVTLISVKSSQVQPC